MVETHDRIVGRTYREAARTCDAQLGNETASVREALRAVLFHLRDAFRAGDVWLARTRRYGDVRRVRLFFVDGFFAYS